MAHSFGGLAVSLAVEKLDDNHSKRLVLLAPATETTHAIKTFFTYITVSAKVKHEFEKLLEEMGGLPVFYSR